MLYTPDTLLALFTHDRLSESHWRDNQWTIGRLVVGTTAAIYIDAQAFDTDPELVLNCQIARANDRNKAVSVSISETAEQFDESRSLGTNSPRVLVGVEAVRNVAEVFYPYDESRPPVLRISPQESNFLDALGLSSIKLSELGYPEEYVTQTRVQALRNITNVVRGDQHYYEQIPLLTPTCASNEEAHSLILQQIPADKSAWGINPRFSYDLDQLKLSFETETE